MSEATAPPASTEAPPRNRWLILAICCMSLFIVGLDVSALNLALPSIRTSLNTSESTLQWILDAYTIVLASLLMLSGSVADRVGRKLVFRIGLVIFGLGSVLCTFATSGEFLIAARMLQAVGGSMLNPVAMSIITNTFTDAKERAQAIGMWGMAIGLSTALGPLIGGGLVEGIGWEAIFWMNVPVVILALILTTIYVPESRSEHPRSLDPAGQVLIMLMLGTLTYAIIEGREDGWTSNIVLGCFAVSAVSLAALAVVENRVKQPLVNPTFFKSWPFSGAVVSAIVGFAAMSGFVFITALYLQTSRGYSPIHAGVLTLPMAVMNGAMAPISGRIVGSRGPKIPMVISGIAISLSALILLRLTMTTPTWEVLLAFGLFGFGFGMLNAPITNSAVSGMPRSQAGVASGIASASRQVGSALGVALFGTLTFNGISGPVPAGLPTASHAAWALMLGCGITLIVVALIATSNAARRSSERVQREISFDG